MEFTPFNTRNYPTLSAKDGYTEWANTYEDSVEEEMDLRLLSRVDVDWKTMKTAIDLACGTGRIGLWLKAQGVQSIDGIDLTKEMLQQATKKGVYNNLVEGRVQNTGLPNNSYDLSIQVLADEHLHDLNPLYSEAARITKKGGCFIIVGYHPHFLMNGLVTHFHRPDGEAVAIESYVHLLSDHYKAAKQANIMLEMMDEGIIDNEWLAKKTKWEKYRNRPVSFIYVWRKGAE